MSTWNIALFIADFIIFNSFIDSVRHHKSFLNSVFKCVHLFVMVSELGVLIVNQFLNQNYGSIFQ